MSRNRMRADGFSAYFKTATDGFMPYRWQVELPLDGLPDMLRVPTGLGKTEVALAWAWRLLIDKQAEPLHLVICLPMRSLVTQTVQRLKGYFEALGATKPEIDVGAHQLMGGAIDAESKRDNTSLLTSGQVSVSRALPVPHVLANLTTTEVLHAPPSIQSEKPTGTQRDVRWWARASTPAPRLDVWSDEAEKKQNGVNRKRTEHDLFIHRASANEACTTTLTQRRCSTSCRRSNNSKLFTRVLVRWLRADSRKGSSREGTR